MTRLTGTPTFTGSLRLLLRVTVQYGSQYGFCTVYLQFPYDPSPRIREKPARVKDRARPWKRALSLLRSREAVYPGLERGEAVQARDP